MDVPELLEGAPKRGEKWIVAASRLVGFALQCIGFCVVPQLFVRRLLKMKASERWACIGGYYGLACLAWTAAAFRASPEGLSELPECGWRPLLGVVVLAVLMQLWFVPETVGDPAPDTRRVGRALLVASLVMATFFALTGLLLAVVPRVAEPEQAASGCGLAFFVILLVCSYSASAALLEAFRSVRSPWLRLVGLWTSVFLLLLLTGTGEKPEPGTTDPSPQSATSSAPPR